MNHQQITLALEEMNQLSARTGRAADVLQSLRQGTFTMDLALEADQIIPGLGAVNTYFSTTANKRQVALEGLASGIWEAIVGFFRKIIEFFKSLFSSSAKEEKRAEQVQRDLQQAQDSAKDLERAAQKVKITDLDRFIEEYVQTNPHTKLATLLENGRSPVVQWLFAGVDDRAYGTLLEELVQQLPTVTEFINHEMLPHLQGYVKVFEKIAAGGAPEDTFDALHALREIPELTLHFKSAGRLALKKFFETFSDASKEASFGNQISFRKLRQGIANKAQPKFTQVQQNRAHFGESLAKLNKLAQEQLQHAETVRERYNRKYEEEPMRYVRDSTASAGLWQGMMTYQQHIRDLSAVEREARAYTLMAEHVARYWENVMREVKRVLQDHAEQIDSSEAADLFKEMDRKYAHLKS